MATENPKKTKTRNTLVIDIGGTYIKMIVLDFKGLPLTEYIRALTPRPATVNAVCTLIKETIAGLNIQFERITAGFPGVIHNDVIKTAKNMHPSWVGIQFQKQLQYILGHPTRVANDADIQGFGYVSGKGVELVITLGTGTGSALFINGKLVPNLELGHHPFYDNKTYEDCLGIEALQKFGIATWRKNLKAAILLWQRIFNYDKLYLGGGNAKKVNFKLSSSVTISDDIEGILGGIKLWE